MVVDHSGFSLALFDNSLVKPTYMSTICENEFGLLFSIGLRTIAFPQ